MPYPEKPWYYSIIVAYLSYDVPELIGVKPAALARDILTLEHRVTMEGESFLTKTLPAFGKSFDFALQERSPLSVSGFKKKPRSALPAFLQALTGRVFEDDGHVKQEPCISSIRAVRQVCYWCKKVEKGFTNESLQKATTTFVEVDKALPAVSLHTDRKLLGLARKIVSRILGNCPGLGEIKPKHGPGTVAWSSDSVDKFRLRISYKNLERVFRPIPFFRSLRDASENPACVTERPSTEYGLSRLAFVEKDSSGPRLIGLEPAEYMWCQQALKRWLYNHIEKRSFAKGRINFTDQSVNRELTSHWQNFDTLDMSSASDRNSLDLVRVLFSGTRIYPYLMACRTPGIVLPDESVLLYKKFAPMGSAVCFPIEALVFYALAVSSLVKAGMSQLKALKFTFVYGDDLVVPHGFYETLVSDFESVGLKFSDAKCCVSGKFRESCGRDAYDGHDVTPVRLRKPYAKRNLSDLVSLVEHANALMKRGYTAASYRLRKLAKDLYPKLRVLRLPLSEYDELPILTWLDYKRSTLKVFVKDSLTCVRGYTVAPYKVRANDADEAFYLRVSLSLGGPVGELITSRGKTERWLPLRYQSGLLKRTHVLAPGKVPEPMEQKLPKRFPGL